MFSPKRDALLFLIVTVTFGTLLVSGDEPFESLLVRLDCYEEKPQDCEPKDNIDFTDGNPNYAWSFDGLTKATTHFYLFTQSNPDEPELLHKCNASTPKNSNFNESCRTEIIIPGFVSGVCNFAIYRELKNERLKCGCYNVILVDWMWGNIPDLIEAKKNLKKILAHQIAILIRHLKKKYLLRAKDFIITGHSYGAHCAGFVGQIEPIGSINGIAPAGVVFTEKDPLDDRLDAGDAPCVQVTHCNAGQCLPKYFEVNFTCGTMDFFYNGGLEQPGCEYQIKTAFEKGDFIYGFINLYPTVCWHFKCLEYYKASICPTDDCQFLGVHCPNNISFQKGDCRKCGDNGERCAISGAYACDCATEENKGRSFYLNTKPDCPYCDKSSVDKGGYECPAALEIN